MSEKTQYVLGFWFLGAASNAMVTLIQKVKPEWQAGLLNGVGGKIESHDLDPLHAMKREFHEETGVLTERENWICFGTMEFNEATVYLFTGVSTPAHDIPKTVTQETVRTVPLRFVPGSSEVIPNLRFLVPLAIQVALNPDAMQLNATFDFTTP